VQTQGGPTLNALCVTADGNKLAVAGSEHIVRIFHIEDGASMTLEAAPSVLGGSPAVPGRLSGHSLKIVCLRSDYSNPNLLYSAGIDRKILRWDLRTGNDAVAAIHGPQLSGDSMDISRDGTTMLTAMHRGSDRPLQLFDMRRLSAPFSTLTEACASYHWTGDEPTLDPKAKPGTCLIFGVAWNSDSNKCIAAAGQHENVAKAFVRNDDPARPLHTVGKLEHAAGGFWSVAASPDGSRMAYGCVDGSVHLGILPARFGSGGRSPYMEQP
jgi:WD40 repeat protein